LEQLTQKNLTAGENEHFWEITREMILDTGLTDNKLTTTLEPTASSYSIRIRRSPASC